MKIEVLKNIILLLENNNFNDLAWYKQEEVIEDPKEPTEEDIANGNFFGSFGDIYSIFRAIDEKEQSVLVHTYLARKNNEGTRTEFVPFVENSNLESFGGLKAIKADKEAVIARVKEKLLQLTAQVA